MYRVAWTCKSWARKKMRTLYHCCCRRTSPVCQTSLCHLELDRVRLLEAEDAWSAMRCSSASSCASASWASLRPLRIYSMSLNTNCPDDGLRLKNEHPLLISAQPPNLQVQAGRGTVHSYLGFELAFRLWVETNTWSHYSPKLTVHKKKSHLIRFVYPW